MIGPIIDRAIDRILPSRCAICAAPGQDGLPLCGGCLAELPRLANHCTVCASPIEATTPVICGHCQQAPPAYDHTIVPLLYQKPVDHLVIGLKFSARLAYAKILAQLFTDSLGDHERPELLIPMPLHKKRLRQRGFNQSLELARLISKKTGIPVDAHVSERTRHTEPQSTLPAKEKKQNVKDAFAVNQPIEARHVAIIDDVMTSGHTANELACVLKATGVKRVDIWVMARAGAKSG